MTAPPPVSWRSAWTGGRAGDALLGVVLAAAELALLATAGPLGPPFPMAAALVVAATLPLAVRRRAPLAVFVATAVAGALAVAVDLPGPVLGPAVALFNVALLLPRRRSLVALGGALALLVGLLLVRVEQRGAAYLTSTLVMAVLSTVGIWALGAYLRARRAYEQERVLRAEQDVREREARARLVLAEERAHLARELHDVLAHSLGSVVVLAGTARHLAGEQPGAAPRLAEVLSALEHAGRDGLAEVRQLLGVLRDADAGPAPLSPPEGLARLDVLVEQVRQAGVQVELAVDGVPAPLPAAVDVSAYRIVQEALTNVLRHAAATRVEVTLDHGPDGLVVRVRDDGRGGQAGAGEGHGLAGMAERVALLSGDLSAGPAAGEGCGWEVCARLPMSTAGPGPGPDPDLEGA